MTMEANSFGRLHSGIWDKDEKKNTQKLQLVYFDVPDI